MEEELQRPLETPLEKESERPQERSSLGTHEATIQPPPLPEVQKQRERERSITTTKRVARVTPSNPFELPSILENTIYACVTSDALRHSGQPPRFRVPKGFIGLLADQDGNTQSTLLSGEEAEGTFHLHLFRKGTQLMSQHLHGLTSKDGFNLNASLTYGFRFPDGDTKSLQDFILSHVLGRTHFSGALLNADIERESRNAIAAIASEMNADQLVTNAQRSAFEKDFIEALEKRLSASGITIRGLDALAFTSHDLDESKRKEAKMARRADESVKKEEVKAVIARERLGAELSRQELSEVLDSVRQRRELTELEHDRERLAREKALETLEREYRADQFNLDSAMRKTLAQTDLEIDRLKFEEYLRMTGEVRERLQEDRIEFYINQIKDESLKARLLLRLMEKDMTPEQLSELADLERARAESARVSQGSLPLVETAEVEEQADPEAAEVEPEERPSFKMAFVSPEATSPTFGNQTAAAQHQDTAVAPGFQTQAAPPQLRENQEGPPPLPQMQSASATKEDSLGGQLSTLLVTAGRKILAIDVGVGSSSPREFANFSNNALGSLRSLTIEHLGNESFVLAGARRGVYRISLATGQASQFPIDSGIAPQTGVNATLAFRGSIYATHSQFGLLRWANSAVNYPATRVARELSRNAQTVRALFLDQDEWPTFACGNRIVAIEHGVVSRPVAIYAGAPSEVLAIHGSETHFTAVCRGGQVVTWRKDQPQQPQTLTQIGGKVFSAASSGDGSSFLLSLRDNFVRVLNLKTQMISRYDAPCDIVAAKEFGKVIVGIAKDRARLIVWESFGDGRPFLEIPMQEPPYDIVTL